MEMKKREFWPVFGLTLITCGIYYYFWLYQTTKQINQMAGDDGETIDPTLALVLSIVLPGVYMWWWYYKQGDRLQAMGAANQMQITENGTTYLLWILLGSLVCGIGALVGEYLFIKNTNLLIDRYNAGTHM